MWLAVPAPDEPKVSVSGLLFASAGLLGSYDIDPRWAVIASIEGRRLQGDAARSPLTEKKSSYDAVAGLAYRF